MICNFERDFERGYKTDYKKITIIVLETKTLEKYQYIVNI